MTHEEQVVLRSWAAVTLDEEVDAMRLGSCIAPPGHRERGLLDALAIASCIMDELDGVAGVGQARRVQLRVRCLVTEIKHGA